VTIELKCNQKYTFCCVAKSI